MPIGRETDTARIGRLPDTRTALDPISIRRVGFRAVCQRCGPSPLRPVRRPTRPSESRPAPWPRPNPTWRRLRQRRLRTHLCLWPTSPAVQAPCRPYAWFQKRRRSDPHSASAVGWSRNRKSADFFSAISAYRRLKRTGCGAKVVRCRAKRSVTGPPNLTAGQLLSAAAFPQKPLKGSR
jgi:hypothetical protein